MFRIAIIVIAAAILASAVIAEPTAPVPVQKENKRSVGIHRGTSPVKHSAVGKIMLTAFIPIGVQPSTVVFYLDNKEISRVERKPYSTDWDSTAVTDGEHLASWKAFDADDKELAAGSITLVVSNGSINQTKDNNAKAEIPMERYFSSLHKISFEHPAGWTVKDQSASVPKDWKEGYWLVLSTDPVAEALYVVNIRHRLLQTVHTSESFLKNTPYLSDWQQADIAGRPAFVTTAGLPSAKRVVHRIQMLDGRHLWMINFVDTSGRPADESKALMMKIAGSITIPGAGDEERGGDVE